MAHALRYSIRSKLALLAATLGVIFGVGLVTVDALGFGPNLGLPFGYYARFNSIVDRIEQRGDVEILATTLHKDVTLEDFYITVRKRGGPELNLDFWGASTRPFPELVGELEKIGR